MIIISRITVFFKASIEFFFAYVFPKRQDLQDQIGNKRPHQVVRYRRQISSGGEAVYADPHFEYNGD